MNASVGRDGYCQKLGNRHAAVFLENKPTLLVSFESHQKICAQSPKAHPLGWTMAKAVGWSHLAVLSDGDTWFREPKLHRYIEQLMRDGFFRDFKQVIFYGAGPGGYAAAAFSNAAPGARVLALQPQATLDPRVAEWDRRFTDMRRTAFDGRFGYAPNMLETAEQALVLYDPEVELDAMHAALFYRPNVLRTRLRFFGPDTEASLLRMRILFRILAQFSTGRLAPQGLAKLLRARRDDAGFLWHLINKNKQVGAVDRVARLSRHILQRDADPAFRRAIERTDAWAKAQRKPAQLQKID